MENVGMSNTGTAPLINYDFFERMRHPSAADLHRAIKSFIVSFSSNAPDPERDSKNVQEFLTRMEPTFKAHPLWAGATKDQLDSVGDGLERYLMTKLFNRAFASVPEDAKYDQELSEKTKLLQQFIRPGHLNKLLKSQNETSWQLAQEELQKIKTCKAPRDKLACILDCCRVINNSLLNVSMAANDNPPGADGFLHVLIYVTIKVNPPQLHSNLLYIRRYRRRSRLVSEAAYFFTNLVSVESFISNIDAKSLSMDEGEFERNMTAARFAVNGSTGRSTVEAWNLMSESTFPKAQVPELQKKERTEEALSAAGENQASRTLAKGTADFGNTDKSKKGNVKDNLEESELTVSKLENEVEGEFERNMTAARFAVNGSTGRSTVEAWHLMSESTFPKAQVPKLQKKERTEEFLSAVGENQPSRTLAKGTADFGNTDKSKKGNVKDNLEESELTLSKLENEGAVQVLHADCTCKLKREYPFLYVSAGDLRVGDVESLLSAYKELVLKHISLSKAVESSLSPKTRCAFEGDAQSRGINPVVSKEQIFFYQEMKNIDENGLPLDTESYHHESLFLSTGSANTNGELHAAIRTEALEM